MVGLIMNILTIDFETHDQYIDRDVGAGWVYGIRLENSDFEVLGASIKIGSDNTYYETIESNILDVVAMADTLIMHHAPYDLGCLMYLEFKYSVNLNLDRKLIYDTKIMAKLFNNVMPSYTLDALAEQFLGEKKDNKRLVEFVWESGLYSSKQKGKVKGRPDDSKLEKFAKSHMKEIQAMSFDTMAYYANKDVELTYSLFEYFKKFVDLEQSNKYSRLGLITNKMRARGIRVDLKKANEVSTFLSNRIVELTNKLYEDAGEVFNYNSSQKLAKILDKFHIKYERTDKGNVSITSKFLEKQDHPICKQIVNIKKYTKIKKDFIDKFIALQQHTTDFNEPGVGWLYPELNLFEARTGRFSSSSPNLQQIPSRDKELAPLCRSIFIANPGEKFYSLDFSNQEGRIHVHYANKLGCKGATEIVAKFHKNPMYDIHQEVADSISITRKLAKEIYLGIGYGMGKVKLSKQLAVRIDEAVEIKKRFNNKYPFLNELFKICLEKLKRTGFIRTLGGRILRLKTPNYEAGEESEEYKGLNMATQGSAADQTIEAIIEADRQGIPILFPIHDELIFSGTFEQAEGLKYIMERAIPLSIPVIAEIGEGDNWAEAKQ